MFAAVAAGGCSEREGEFAMPAPPRSAAIFGPLDDEEDSVPLVTFV